MKKISLFFLALCVAAISCQKAVKVPVEYSIENAQGAALQDINVPDSGTYDLAVWIKFLTGSATDKVTLTLQGLPGDVHLTEDTISGVPTYTGHFIFNTTHAVQATYPVTLVATAKGAKTQTRQFNMTIVPADCASGIFGTYSGANACTARSYAYTATVGGNGNRNELNINNLGGYGPNTNTRVILNCIHDSLTIPDQNIGNGTVLSGYGVFTGSSMTIYYTASSTPTGIPETCTATLTR